MRSLNSTKFFGNDQRQDWGGIVEDFYFDHFSRKYRHLESCFYIAFDVGVQDGEIGFNHHEKVYYYKPSKPQPFLGVGAFGSEVPIEFWPIVSHGRMKQTFSTLFEAEEFVISFLIVTKSNGNSRRRLIPYWIPKGSVLAELLFARITKEGTHVSVDRSVLLECLKEKLEEVMHRNGNLDGFEQGELLERYFGLA